MLTDKNGNKCYLCFEKHVHFTVLHSSQLEATFMVVDKWKWHWHPKVLLWNLYVLCFKRQMTGQTVYNPKKKSRKKKKEESPAMILPNESEHVTWRHLCAHTYMQLIFRQLSHHCDPHASQPPLGNYTGGRTTQPKLIWWERKVQKPKMEMDGGREGSGG